LTPTFKTRRNDIAPGFTAASNVRLGSINTSNLAMNNSGTLAFAATLQGAATATVGPVATTYFPPPFGLPTPGAPLITPGVMGNDTAIFAGTPGMTGPTGLRALARTGDAAPGFTGYYYNVQPSQGSSVLLNNAGDVLFKSQVVNTAAGTEFTINGWQLATGSNYPTQSSIDALFGYSAALDTIVPMLYVGQSIEVATGVFKYISQYGVNSGDNGDGSSVGLNDDGTFVAWVRLADAPGGNPTSTSYVVLQIPAPATAVLGLVGLGAMGRRRRR
jgi:uncharacterized protein (TIGR03382 family)